MTANQVILHLRELSHETLFVAAGFVRVVWHIGSNYEFEAMLAAQENRPLPFGVNGKFDFGGVPSVSYMNLGSAGICRWPRSNHFQRTHSSIG